MSKPKIKYKIYGDKVSTTQIDEIYKFSCKFNATVRKYLKSFEEQNTKIIPSTFSQYWKDHTCVPFWDDKVKNISNKLFLPSNNNMVKDEITQINFNKNKWFNNEFYESKYGNADKIRCNIDEEQEGTVTKTVKIKLYCDEIQKQTLKRFFGVYRYFYNRTIDYTNNINKETMESHYYVDFKDKSTKKVVKLEKSYYNWISLKKSLYQNQPKWMKEIKFDSHSCKQAIKEALTGITTNIKVGRKFKMKKKTKKDLVNTLNIEKEAVSKKYKTIFSCYKVDDTYVFRNLKMSDDITKYDLGTATISYHRILNEFTINLTYTEDKKINNETKVGALDPGVNNFMTCYSEYSICKLGISCDTKIEKICNEIDIIHSRIDKGYYYKDEEKKIVNANRRRNLRKALHRKIKYIKDLRNELHKQVINYLADNFGKIIISPFKTQEMVQKLSSKIARRMNTLSHYMFRMRLKNKFKELNKVVEVKEEHYTSQTCTKCGNIKSDLGNAKVYKCGKCKMVMERDFNGARNIMLRNNY